MWKRVQWLLALFILIFYAGLLTPSEAGEGGSDPFMNQVSILFQIIVIPLTLVLVLANLNRIITGLRVTIWPAAISLMLISSTEWSLEPPITLRRSLIFLFSTLFAIYIGACLTQEEQIDLYGTVTLLSVVGSYLIVILLPSYGISTDVHAGEWKGLFQHKNALGRQMVFAIALLAGGKPFKFVYVRRALIVGALLLLALSRSGTALMGFAFLAIGYITVNLMRVKSRRTLPLWLALVPVGLIFSAAAYVFRDQILFFVGKDPTLTGRTQIWATAFSGIAKRPVRGYGYSVFWRQVRLRPLFGGLPVPTHSHDGFFDIVIDTGFAGLAIFILSLYAYLSRILRRVLDQRVPLSNFSLFAFLYIFIFIALNLTESNLLREHTFLWLPFVSIYTAMALQDTPPRNAYASDSTIQLESGELVHHSQ